MQTLAYEQSPQQQMTDRLDALANALDGFPVQALLADCLETAAAAPAGKDHTALLVDRVLNRWIDRLGQDIEQLPPSTLEVLRAISQRTHATREALIEVRALFDRLVSPAAAGVAKAGAQLGAQLDAKPASSSSA